MSQQSGFPFPAIARGARGPLVYVSNDTLQLVKSSIYQILTTMPGERPWNPEFGCPVQKMLFESITETNMDAIASLVYEALTQWEPRISLVPSDVLVTQSNGRVSVRVSYSLNVPADADQDSIIVTF